MAVRPAPLLSRASRLLVKEGLRGFSVWSAQEDETSGRIEVLLTTETGPKTAVLWEGVLYQLEVGWTA